MNGSITFHNRFPSLKKFEDRICDADFHPDYDPRWFREDTSMLKYDVFLKAGWTWYPISSYHDCQRTECFRTMAELKRALAKAVKLLPDSPVCRACPHFVNGECDR